MLRSIIAFSALIIPASAFAADAPAVQLLERDGIKYEYTTSAGPFGGLTIKGRELPSSVTAWRKSFTLYVSPKGIVSGEYGGSPVDFHVAGFNSATVKTASVVPATQIATK